MADDDNSKPSNDGGSALPERKRLFAAAYHASRNATQAAISAGYSRNGAQQTGSRLLKDPAVRAELQRLADEAPEQAPEHRTPAKPPPPPKPDVWPPINQPPVTASTAAQLMARQPVPDRPQVDQPPLTMMEEAFLNEYLRNGCNGTAAWMFCHPGCAPRTAAAEASRALRRPRVAARLAAERRRLVERYEMDRDQLLQEFLAIVRADPNELMQMRQVACQSCWGGAANAGRWADPDPECADCSGDGMPMPWFADTRRLSPEARALFAGVRVTREGATILTHDKMAALVNIGKILGAFEADNRQKNSTLADAIAQFVGQIHNEGAGRLQFSPPRGLTNARAESP